MEITRFLPNISDLVGHQAITLSQMLPNTLLTNFIIMYLQTTLKKKAQNGDAETHGQSYYKT